MNKIVVAIEGPAGAGKSTVISSLHSQQLMMSGEIFKEAIHLPEISRPRTYEGNVGLNLSVIKDQMSALAVANYQDKLPIALDRYHLSAWVYNRIRSGYNSPINKRGFHQVLMMAYNQLVEVDEVWRNRRDLAAPITRSIEPLQLHYAFLMPNIEVLWDNRQAAGRPFPYTAISETQTYLEAIGQILGLSSQHAIGRIDNFITYQVLTPETSEQLADAPLQLVSGLQTALLAKAEKDVLCSVN